jgi:hypothetical protein
MFKNHIILKFKMIKKPKYNNIPVSPLCPPLENNLDYLFQINCPIINNSHKSDLNDTYISAKSGFLKNAFLSPLSKFWSDTFQDRGLEIIRTFDSLKKLYAVSTPYSFFPLSSGKNNSKSKSDNALISSCLLRSCRAPSRSIHAEEACVLEIKLDDVFSLEEIMKSKKPFIEYRLKNVTDTDQALALMMLAYNWMNSLEH